MALTPDVAHRASPPKARGEDVLAAVLALLGVAAYGLVAILLSH